MTTITGSNTFSNTSTGPTAGTPRTALSVNQTAAQQPMNNTWALANGYGLKYSFSLLTAATHDTQRQFLHGIAGGSSDTLAQTIQFGDVATNHYWKHAFFDRLTQGTVLTFQAGASPVTFLTWTAPADMADVWMTFNHSGVSGTWELFGVQWTRGNVREIAMTSATTFSITTYPREIYIYPTAGDTIGSGPTNIDLDADYKSGDRMTVFVRGLGAGTIFSIRDDSDNVIIELSAVRDGHDCTVELRYLAGAWAVMAVQAGTRTTESTSGDDTFIQHTATTQTLTLTRQHHYFDTVNGSIVLTIPDGTFIGQRASLYFDSIGSGGGVSIKFTGTGSPSTMSVSGTKSFCHWGAIWNGARWFVTSRID